MKSAHESDKMTTFAHTINKTEMEQEFASRLLESAVSEFAKLPGIGRKTALRLVLHLLKQDEQEAVTFGEAII